jgi:leader peptidase (prepilin peptidase)/N-methyltransferase
MGYREVVAGFVISFLVAGVPAALLLAFRKVQRRTKIPFGPFLAAGTIITVLFGAPIIHAWSSV